MNEKDPVTFRDKVTATEARLKLNKAAPDLLKALYAVQCCESGWPEIVALAIDKAEGRTNHE